MLCTHLRRQAGRLRRININRGMLVLDEYRRLEEGPMDKKARAVLYGKAQYKKR